MLYYIIIIFLLIPLSILVPIKKIGKKNLKELKGKHYIISCNHMSNWDPVMMDIKFNRKHRFLAKKELFKNKFFGACMKSFGAIPVDRSKPDPSSIKEVFRHLNKGHHVCIFPQGTRAKTTRVEGGSAKEGVAMFSIRTNTPVVPMMYTRKLKMFRRAKLLIGKPLYPDEERKKDKDYVTEFANLIVESMNNLLEGVKLNEDERL